VIRPRREIETADQNFSSFASLRLAFTLRVGCSNRECDGLSDARHYKLVMDVLSRVAYSLARSADSLLQISASIASDFISTSALPPTHSPGQRATHTTRRTTPLTPHTPHTSAARVGATPAAVAALCSASSIFCYGSLCMCSSLPSLLIRLARSMQTGCFPPAGWYTGDDSLHFSSWPTLLLHPPPLSALPMVRRSRIGCHSRLTPS
jgi:hypothetical protein